MKSQSRPAPPAPVAAAPEPEPSPSWKAYLAMSLATVLWASNIPAIKFAVRELPQLGTAALRVTLSAAALLMVYAAQGGRFSLPQGEARNFLRISLWGLALSFVFFTMGVNHTSVSHAVFVGSLGPMAVLLLARLYGLERITGPKLAGLVVGLLGVLSLALDHEGGAGPSWQGDLLVVVGVSCFAYFTIVSKKAAATYDSLSFITLSFLAAAIWLLPLLVWESARLPWRQVSWVAWSGLLYSAVLGSAGAYLAYYYSLRLVSATRAAAFHYFQPVVATVLGVIFFQEKLTAPLGLAAVLILAGVYMTQRR